MFRNIPGRFSLIFVDLTARELGGGDWFFYIVLSTPGQITLGHNIAFFSSRQVTLSHNIVLSPGGQVTLGHNIAFSSSRQVTLSHNTAPLPSWTGHTQS
jgi:hypothetical protein